MPKIFIDSKTPVLHFKQDIMFLKSVKFSGYVYQLDSSRKDTILISGYLNGLLSGLTNKRFENGNIKEYRCYLKGKKNGKQISYWENGNKRFEFLAKNDAYEGVLKEWDVEGKLYHLGNFVNGQEEGSQKMWYQNGKIKANYVVRNGKRYGLLGTKNCMNVSDSIFNNQ